MKRTLSRCYLIPFLIALLVIVVSCKKQSVKTSAMGAAPPLMYEIVDKNGNSIFNESTTSPKDSVLLTYAGGGHFYDYVFNLNALPSSYSSYVSLYKKYNGFVIWDAYPMLELSTSSLPVNTFNLSYHGQNLGTIYFKYLKQQSDWQEASAFTFNNVPVKMDTTGGWHMYVIQLQQ